MKIGTIKLSTNVISAPLAGYSDLAFRLINKEQGAGLVYSEMINVIGTARVSKKTLDLMKISPKEKPVALQLFGKDPEAFAKAVPIAEKHGADIIDINMGCPASKVVVGSQGSGAALMKDPALVEAIIKATVGAAKVPVTVKFRSGWDKKTINVVELSQMAEKIGISAICVHPRTRQEEFRGHAEWTIIKKVKDAVHVPVIGSGDIKTPQDAKRMMDETGCDAVMLGRVAIGNPWIFAQVVHYLKTGKELPPPAFQERIKMYLHHTQLLIDLKGEKRAILEMRKFGHRYVSGEPGASHLRQKINAITTYSDLKDLFSSI